MNAEPSDLALMDYVRDYGSWYSGDTSSIINNALTQKSWNI